MHCVHHAGHVVKMRAKNSMNNSAAAGRMSKHVLPCRIVRHELPNPIVDKQF